MRIRSGRVRGRKWESAVKPNITASAKRRAPTGVAAAQRVLERAGLPDESQWTKLDAARGGGVRAPGSGVVGSGQVHRCAVAPQQAECGPDVGFVAAQATGDDLASGGEVEAGRHPAAESHTEGQGGDVEQLVPPREELEAVADAERGGAPGQRPDGAEIG
jgi:hypothetical protein